jgi:hypothetical protein
VTAVELCGENFKPRKRAVVVGVGLCLAQPTLDRRSVAFGEMIEHVALLVADAPLHGRADAKHVTHRLAKCLGAVEHDQHALLDIQAAINEV